MLLLVVIVIGLPLYWVFEPEPPGRRAREGSREAASSGGARDLFAPTADGGFNCAGCHGGMNATGGEAPYTVTDPATGEVRAVDWKAPALNTVLYRFDEDEVRYIITYGRPGSPMSAWGLDGGGPMNAQQIETLIDYLKSIQIPREDCTAEEEDDPLCETGHLPAEIQADIETHGPPVRRGRRRTPATARRCSTSSSPAARTAAPAATPRAGATATRRARPGRVRLEPHRRQRGRPVPERART